MFNPNISPSSEQDPRHINPKYEDAIKQGEDGQSYLDEDVLSAIERDNVVRLTAEKIAEIDRYLADPKTPELLKKIFERVKRNHAKTVGGIEEIVYH
jgi:hypothetical protein